MALDFVKRYNPQEFLAPNASVSGLGNDERREHQPDGVYSMATWPAVCAAG